MLKKHLRKAEEPSLENTQGGKNDLRKSKKVKDMQTKKIEKKKSESSFNCCSANDPGSSKKDMNDLGKLARKPSMRQAPSLRKTGKTLDEK